MKTTIYTPDIIAFCILDITYYLHFYTLWSTNSLLNEVFLWMSSFSILLRDSRAWQGWSWYTLHLLTCIVIRRLDLAQSLFFFCMLSLLVLLIHTDVHAKAIKTEDMCICKKTKSTWYIVVQYVIIMLNMCCNLSCHRNDSCFTCTFDFIRTSSKSTEGWKCLKKGYILFIAMQFRRMHITYLKRISYLSFHWI